MENNNKDEYLFYRQSDVDKTYYFKNGLLHREVGPAIVIRKDQEKYSNLSDKDLYKEMTVPLYPPINEPYSEDNIFETISNVVMNDSEYYLEGKQYEEEEFKILMLKKELDTNLNTNEPTTKRIKI